MMKKNGFTLAEVLITLGIIGVVAAMTIPTLIANTNSAKFRSQFKKTISTLNQAGLMGQAQYDFDYGAAAACESGKEASENPTSTLSFCALLNGTLTGQTYQGAVKDIKLDATNKYQFIKAGETTKGTALTTGAAGDYIAYSLADGALVAFSNAAKTTACTLDLGTSIDADWITKHPQCVGFIDVNGITLPNKEVSCKTATETAPNPTTTCEVPNTAGNMTDIFPVLFHDATVEPATNAAKYILTTSK